MDFIYDPSLMLYLPLYELDGASFASRDAYGHLCTVTGAGWRPNGSYFDGSDDLINCGTGASLQFTGSFTVGIWLKRNGVGTDQRVIGRYDHVNNKRIWLLYFPADNKFYLAISQNGVTGVAQIADDAYSSTTDWYCIQAVYDSSVPTIYLYVNGNIIDATPAGSFPSSMLSDSTVPAYIGASQVPGEYLNGVLGEVWLHNRALTPQEIQHNYLATKWRYR